MSLSLSKQSSYVRLLDGTGTALTSTTGVLDVNVSTALEVTQSTHDSLNCNATLQISNADLAFGQTTKALSLPVTVVSDQGNLAVSQGTHDSLNCNATLQIADTDLAFGQAAMAASLPVTIANNQSALDTAVTVIPTAGTQNNVWNNATVVLDEVSSAIDCQYVKHVDIFGINTTGVGNLTVQMSQDGTTYYDTGTWVFTSDATDFHGSLSVGARYIRLKASIAQTGLYCTVAGKA